MTDHRDDERERSDQQEKRRREERERRSDTLKEAWRRHHPSELEEGPVRRKKGDRESKGLGYHLCLRSAPRRFG